MSFRAALLFDLDGTLVDTERDNVESVVLAIIGGAIGAVAASAGLAAFQDPISNSLNISFLWPSMMTVLSQMSLALAFAVALAGIAALWPAFRASRMEPYDAIRKGQN